MTMNDTWGYKSYDNNWKSSETLIRNLIDIASKGGNYLLNVGPTSEGLIPEPSVERLEAIGRWMKLNSESIYDTAASPFKRLPWGRCTKKLTPRGATLYLHVFDWPSNGRLLVPGLKNQVEKAYLLTEKHHALAAQAGADGVILSVPATAPDPMSSTIVLKVKGPLEIDQPVLAQQEDGVVMLPASEARLHGEQINTNPAAGMTISVSGSIRRTLPSGNSPLPSPADLKSPPRWPPLRRPRSKPT